MKLSDYVIDVLKKEGINHIFEFIGGAIVHLLDSVSNREDMQCISVRHEQAASFAAEAYSRINGNLGVAMATSGPGALNLLTGIGSCYFDSVPCLFITGQVNTYEYKFDRPIRQIGFQETDIVSVARPLTKYAKLVTEPSRIRYCLEKAIWTAKSGRPGPVILDIPMNLQRADIDPDSLDSFYDSEEYKLQSLVQVHDDEINQFIELINRSQRPVILAGGGLRSGNAVEQFRAFVNNTHIPVVTSLMGIDVIPHDHESHFGMIGSYGNRYSNLAVANCDLLIVMGSRLDSRQTGTRPDTFARAAKIIHIDIDENEHNAKVKAHLTILSDLKTFLIKINQIKIESKSYDSWYEKLIELKGRFPTRSGEEEQQQIEPNAFMERLSKYTVSKETFCLDVGQHQMWASQSLHIKEGQRLLNSGGMGAMGFALPAAIGACLAKEGDANVIVIAGDGGFQLNIQELDTIIRYGLPIKMVILNNNSLGMVRQFQELYFDGRKQSTMFTNPNFVGISEAYSIPAFQISTTDEEEEILSAFFGIQGPALLEVHLSSKTVVNPKLVVNRPIEDMYPHLERNELKELMIVDLVEEMDVPK